MSSPRSNIAIALAISLALHALLAVALAFYLDYTPAPDELAQLDLTSVELSFTEAVEETSAAVASVPPQRCARPSAVSLRSAVASGAPRPPVDAAPSPRPVEAAFLPPQMEPKLPLPDEPIEKVKIKTKREVVRHETRDEKPPQETKDEKPHETKDEKPEVARDKKPEPTEAARTPPLQSAPPRQTSALRQARVDAPPKPRRAIKPDYPRASRLRGEEGDVSLELDVDADGTVSNVRILKSPGYPLLDEAAVKAARTARFTPAKSRGKPVATTVRLTLNFRLR